MSKRAGPADAVKSIVSQMWRVDQGPAQNIMRLISYAPSVFGFGGLAITGIDKWLSHYGYGLEDLGVFLDKTELRPLLDNLTADSKHSIDEIHRLGNTMDSDKIVKEAFLLKALWNIMAKKGLLKLTWQVISKTVKYILLAFGFTKMGELYDKLSGFAGVGNIGVGTNIITDVMEPFNSMDKQEDPSFKVENYGPGGYLGPRSTT